MMVVILIHFFSHYKHSLIILNKTMNLYYLIKNVKPYQVVLVSAKEKKPNLKHHKLDKTKLKNI